MIRRVFLAVFLGVVVAVMAWGASGPIIKAIDMDGMAIGFWRFLIYFVVLATWMASRGNAISLRVIRASAAGGVSLGLDVVFFFSAVVVFSILFWWEGRNGDQPEQVDVAATQVAELIPTIEQQAIAAESPVEIAPEQAQQQEARE